MVVSSTHASQPAAHYLFDPDFCNVASGWGKGVVEKNVQDSRRRVWMDAKAQLFGSFDELNVWLEARCRTLWSEIQHPDYAGITVADALEQEQMYLMPMPTPFDGYVEILARVSSTCLVTVQRNRYSVPCHLANHRVAIHLYPDRIEVSSENAVIACHTGSLRVTRSATIGSTTFRLLPRSPVPCATVHHSQTCQFPLRSCKRHCDGENGSRATVSWPVFLPPFLLMA